MENKKLEAIREKSLITIQSEGESLVDRAEAFVVSNNESLKEANDFFQVCKAFREEIYEHLGPVREAIHKAWKGSIAEIDRNEKPFIKAQAIIKPKMIAYKQKIEEEIRKKEEEAQAKIRAEKEEQDRLLRESEALENAGDYGRADEKFEKAEILDEAIKETIQNMKKVPKAPETKGTTMRRIPKWKLFDLDVVPRFYLKLDEVKIGTEVRASKGTVKIPGIEVYFETV